MAHEEKPYRVYRGGRAKGKVPALGRPPRKPSQPPPPTKEGAARYPGPGPAKSAKPRRRWRWLRWAGLVVVLFVFWLAAWSLAGYFSFRDGVKAANKRLPKSAKVQLAHQDGLLLFHATNILVLGTDHGPTKDRSGDNHSDSIMLVRSDPDHHRIVYLSIPRDLYVPIPGHGSAKINAAYQIGGPALTLKTVRDFTGLDINHLAIVDFTRFKDLIDAVGGITIDVKKPILSNQFDCPYTASKCASWKGWRFEKGQQHMDGRRALVYSRIRENQLDPGENDFTRAERQQQVLQAVTAKLASIGTFLDLPFSGGDLLKPLATDLSPGQFLQLGWVKFRSGSGRALHCRLGGTAYTLPDGESVIQPTEENHNVIAMVTGDSAPQPPYPGSGTYGPGCVEGNRPLGSR